MLMGEMPDEADIESLMALVEAVGTDGLTDAESQTWDRYLNARGKPDDHFCNLAEHIEDTELHKIATDVIQWVRWDEDSRRDWMDREQRGIRALGVSEKVDGGADFDGAAKVVHPLLMEACTQFQSRAIAELWPATGPVRTQVLGELTEEKSEQSERVQSYMNYQYTTLMPGAFEEEDKLLFRLPLSGSCFKKVCYDPMERLVVSRFVEPADFIVPYAATDLRTAVRFTHRQFLETDVLRRNMASGLYRKSEEPLSYPWENYDYPTVRKEIEDTEGRKKVSLTGDERHTTYECYCRLDLKGFEDIDPETGEPSGMALPYVVTVDRDSVHVHSIRRNWAEGDELKRRRLYYIHKYFMPGLGFYGYGFLHAIGGLADTATGALRALLDAAGFANHPAGYRSRDSRIPGGTKTPGPGEWVEVDSSAEELAKAFFPLPYKEPSKTLFELLGLIQDQAQRFASTTEAMVGEANNTGPVGTTLALIEQGSKVFSAIHKRLHQANTHEFKLVAELNYEWMPEQYPYDTPEGSKYTLREDFDGRIDVIPVSDPNIVSNVQRIAQAQAVLQLSQQAPDLYDRKQVHRVLLEALRVPEIDDLMPDTDEVPRREPIEENMALLMGKPIKVFPDQEHQAHMMVHQSWFMGLPPEYQQMLQGAFMAHMAEHMAWSYRIQMQQSIGMQLPAPLTLGQDDDEDPQDIPPEMDYQMSVMAAQVVQIQQMAQEQQVDMQAQQAMQQQQEAHQLTQQVQAQAAEMQAEKTRADVQLAQEKAAREQARKDADLQAKQAREDAKTRAQIMREDALARAQIKAKAEHSPGERMKAESDRIEKGRDYE